MYIAHINRDTGVEQSIQEHLDKTSEKASKFAELFHDRQYAYIASRMHDIGKYSEAFQNKIKNNLDTQVDHSTAGAVEAAKTSDIFGKLLAYCIAGHHGGLPDGGSKSDTAIETTLNGRLKRASQLQDYSAFKEEIDMKLLLPLKPPNIRPLERGGFSLAFFIRMVYSCLVDADFLDTEEFITGNKIDRSFDYDFLRFCNDLNNHIKNFKEPEREINKKRAQILKNCIEKSQGTKGLYTLTVPTGGGKTLSSLAFAIHHVLKHKMERIIYVIPYTSIIEQTADIFKKIVKPENVLEHHSNFDFRDDENTLEYKLRLASENWDIPIVVTTNVQFFESLFAHKSSRCRKLHNMANSVIIFDEAQMLPIPFLTPCLKAITELVVNYEATCVLCSATQPALQGYFPKEIMTKEICEDTDKLYEFFRRTKVVYRGTIESAQLTKEINQCLQALCIVNNKKHAKEIFSKLKGEGIFHLSTRMCPKHRKEAIDEIKKRLDKNLPCKVVSTQLIEAGVDVDFPVVYRAMTGIDSIIQAGGRCNREGRAKLGIIYVFEPESKFTKHMPSSIKRPIAVAKIIMERFEDILSPVAIKAYFEELYRCEGETGLDICNIFKELETGADRCNFNFSFKQVAEDFKLIEENSIPVIVEFDKEAKDLVQKLRYTDEYKGILRSLQTYTVNVYEQEFKSMIGANQLEVVKKEIYVLRDINLYNEDTGLEFGIETGVGIFI